jgi:ankyrin repeat protein
MKLNLTGMLPLVLTLVITSCGKKTEEGRLKSFSESYRPSVEEVYFNALQELRKSVYENDYALLKKVIQENPKLDLDQIGDDGETLLTVAIQKNHIQIRDFLIENGVSLEKSNINKDTPLIVAATYDRLESAMLLIRNNVEINRKNNHGSTALHIALENKNEDLALLLIREGANVEITDEDDQNAYKLAQKHGNQRVLELLKIILHELYGAPKITDFKKVLIEGRDENLKSVLEKYPNLATDYESLNPLVLVQEQKNEVSSWEMIKTLLAYNANINGPKNAELSPLIKSIQLQHTAVASYLIDQKADISLLDNEGKNALIHAIELNNNELVKQLMQYGARRNYFTTLKNGKRMSFDACSLAKKLMQDQMRYSLRCTFRDWFF